MMRGREAVIDAEWVRYRLEHAGKVLLSIPDKGPSLKVRTQSIEVLVELAEGGGYDPDAPIRIPVPDAHSVTMMDEALAWVSMLPAEPTKMRQIVNARLLVSPRTDKHIYSWIKLGKLLGCDPKTVQARHDRAIAIIAYSLRMDDRGRRIAAAARAGVTKRAA